jgi:hypothetical protein
MSIVMVIDGDAPLHCQALTQTYLKDLVFLSAASFSNLSIKDGDITPNEYPWFF